MKKRERLKKGKGLWIALADKALAYFQVNWLQFQSRVYLNVHFHK